MVMKSRNRLLLSGALAMVLASAANAVIFSDVTVTTTTGSYSSPFGYGNSSGEGYFFIPGVYAGGSQDGIEIESVDDIIGPDQFSLVTFSYTVTADAGEKIYSAQVTPGLYTYDADGDISIASNGVVDFQSFSDNGSGFGTSAPDYSISYGAGDDSVVVSGSYLLSTEGSQSPWAVAYADHLEITYSESATPGPESVVPFGIGVAGALIRRRRKQK